MKVGQRGEKDIVESVAAHPCLTFMIKECKQLFKVPFELMNGLSQHEYCLINDFGLNDRAHPNKIFWNSFYIKGMLTIIKFHKTFKSLMMQDPWLSLYWLEYLMKIEEEWLHSLAMDCPRLITILCIIIKVMTRISNWCINKCFNLFSRITMVIYRLHESVNFLEIWTWPWCLTLTFLESWPWTWPLFHVVIKARDLYYSHFVICSNIFFNCLSGWSFSLFELGDCSSDHHSKSWMIGWLLGGSFFSCFWHFQFFWMKREMDEGRYLFERKRR